jgi:hypothetical protein
VPYAGRFVIDRNDAADPLEYCGRDEYSSGVGDLLQACRDVDRIAAGATLLQDDLTGVDADAELNTLLTRQIDVALAVIGLDPERAFKRLHRAWEFRHYSIAATGDDPAVRFTDFTQKAIYCGVDPAMGFFLINRHQAAAAADVGTQNSRKPAPDRRPPADLLKRERDFFRDCHGGSGRMMHLTTHSVCAEEPCCGI